MKVKKPRLVESFGPELMKTLLEGAKKKVEIRLPYRDAVRLRLRLNQLRVAMRTHNHPHKNMVEQVNLRITYDDDTPLESTNYGMVPVNRLAISTLIAEPADSEFSKILREAGMIVAGTETKAVDLLDEIMNEVEKKPL